MESVAFDPETGILTFVFNTSEGQTTTNIDISSLIDTYTAGQSGGEATHKLIINEMPRHAHTAVLAYEQTGYGVTIRPGETYALSGLITNPDYLATNPPDGQPLTNRNERLLHETSSVGNSAPHNNMPPYQTVYMWKRTA